VVKVLGAHPKGKRRKLKHHTTFSFKQQPPGNTCDFFVCLNMVAFGAQSNCVVSVSAFILLSTFKIKFAYSSFADTYFSFYHGRTTKMLSLMCKVLAWSTLDKD
jgi:hypothetical protein